MLSVIKYAFSGLGSASVVRELSLACVTKKKLMHEENHIAANV